MIVQETAQEKSTKEKLILFIDLDTFAMVEEDTKPTEDEPQVFNKALNHQGLVS